MFLFKDKIIEYYEEDKLLFSMNENETLFYNNQEYKIPTNMIEACLGISRTAYMDPYSTNIVGLVGKEKQLLGEFFIKEIKTMEFCTCINYYLRSLVMGKLDSFSLNSVNRFPSYKKLDSSCLNKTYFLVGMQRPFYYGIFDSNGEKHLNKEELLLMDNDNNFFVIGKDDNINMDRIEINIGAAYILKNNDNLFYLDKSEIAVNEMILNNLHSDFFFNAFYTKNNEQIKETEIVDKKSSIGTIAFTLVSMIIIVAIGVYGYLNENLRFLSYIAIGLLVIVLICVVMMIKKNNKSTIEISNKYDYD
jgi:hypothetical protein